MKQVFISYYSEDESKARALAEGMQKTQLIEPIIVADRRTPGEPLSEKVMTGIRQAEYLMPILTKKSIPTQWVNQEIGYAIGLNIEIVPLVDNEIMDELKGFVHKELDLPFRFNSHASDSEKDAEEFQMCYESAFDHILRFVPRIKEPTGDKVEAEYVEVSGGGVPPGNAIILVTSLYGRYLAPQEGGVFSDSSGNWRHERCHLYNIGKDRLIYGLAVNPSDETRVRELLEEYRVDGTPTSRGIRAMDKFSQILGEEGIPFKVTPGKSLIRTA